MAAGFSGKFCHGCSQDPPLDIGIADPELLAAWAEAATGQRSGERDGDPAHFRSCGQPAPSHRATQLAPILVRL